MFHFCLLPFELNETEMIGKWVFGVAVFELSGSQFGFRPKMYKDSGSIAELMMEGVLKVRATAEPGECERRCEIKDEAISANKNLTAISASNRVQELR